MASGHTEMITAQGKESARFIRNNHKVARGSILTSACRLARHVWCRGHPQSKPSRLPVQYYTFAHFRTSPTLVLAISSCQWSST